MADTKISALTALATLDTANDVVVVVDIGSGITKKMTIDSFMSQIGAATFDGDIVSSQTGASTLIKATQSGDFFPYLEVERTGGSTKTNRKWQIE